MTKPKLFATLAACAAAITIIGAPVACSSCATNTGDPGKDARGRATNQALTEAGNVLGKVAVSALFNAASQEANGGAVNWQQSAVSGLYTNINAADTVGAVQRIVQAYSAGNAPQTAAAAAKALNGDVTPEKVAAVAAVISTATGAPPQK